MRDFVISLGENKPNFNKMKRCITAFAICLFFLTSISGQSTERFIRIIGNAGQEFVSNGTVVDFVISEVAPNEYKQIRYKSIDQAYSEFVEEMGKIGVPESELKRTAGNISKYVKTVQRAYSVNSSSQKKLDAIGTINISGVKMSGINYTYQFEEDVEQNLALSAIDDAKRKAKNICAELGMKMGKILNIEDTSSGCCADMTTSKEATMKKTYKVKVTFELLD